MKIKKESTILPLCHACGAQIQNVSEVQVKGKVSSDCRIVKGDCRLAFCASCGLVQKPVSEEWVQEVQEIYSSYNIYNQSGGVEQASFDMATGEYSSRSKKILGWLINEYKIEKSGKLLEIGCGNGSFLQVFGHEFPGWEMTGNELNDINSMAVSKIPGVKNFHVGSIENLDEKFDLIVMIHVLEHIPDPVDFLHKLSKCLKKNGRLLIHVPDLNESPFDLIIADHCSHFSQKTLRNILLTADYSSDNINFFCVPKELTMVARCVDLDNKKNVIQLEKSNDFLTARRHIDWLSKLLEQEIDETKKIAIFGTSISATWLTSAFLDRIVFFVDEDPNRIGRTYFDRPIYSPKDAPVDVDIIIPIKWDMARAIADRLSKFGLNFILPPRQMVG